MPSIAKDDLAELNMATMTRCFSINAFGPFFLTQALLPNILAAPGPRRICVTSSRVGSITDNSSGRYYSYRASKTAVNSFFKNFAVELKDKDVVVSMLHPGFTKSNLDPDDVSVHVIRPLSHNPQPFSRYLSYCLDMDGKAS